MTLFAPKKNHVMLLFFLHFIRLSLVHTYVDSQSRGVVASPGGHPLAYLGCRWNWYLEPFGAVEMLGNPTKLMGRRQDWKFLHAK